MIRLSLLGEVDISMKGTAAALLSEPTRFSILAYIAATHRPYGCRERLTRLLWPDSTRSRAQNALRQALHRIRSELGADVFISGGARLEVNPEVVAVDVWRFRAAMSTGRREEALRLYRGDFLSGFPPLRRREFDDWVDAQRLRLRGSALGAAEELAVESERSKAYHRASHWWRVAVTLSPYDEVNLRRWMRALALEGSPGRALKVFENARRKLETELETRPARSTHALAQAIRAGGDLRCTELTEV